MGEAKKNLLLSVVSQWGPRQANLGGPEAREHQERAGHSLGRSLLCCWGSFSDLTHTPQRAGGISLTGDIPELPGHTPVLCGLG